MLTVTSYEIPPCEPWRVVDPTGAGDGYRAGLLAGYTSGIDWESTGRIASVAATYVVEQKGTQAHPIHRMSSSERFMAEFAEHESALEQLFDASATKLD